MPLFLIFASLAGRVRAQFLSHVPSETLYDRLTPPKILQPHANYFLLKSEVTFGATFSNTFWSADTSAHSEVKIQVPD